MTRVMHSPLEDFSKVFIRPVEFGTDPFNQFAAPTVLLDVKEATDSYIVRAELPGIKNMTLRLISTANIWLLLLKRNRKNQPKKKKNIA